MEGQLLIFLIDGVIHDKQLNSYQAKRMSGLESNIEKTIIGTEMGEEIVRYFSLSQFLNITSIS